MHKKIIDQIPLSSLHTRSISLDRDLLEPIALKNYVVTPNSLSALQIISSGLSSGQAQRAWKVVGPYGSGKSAFAVLLAQLLAGKSNFPVAAKTVSSIAPKVAKGYVNCKRLPLAVVGSRVSFGTAFAASIAKVVEGFGRGKSVLKIRKRLDLIAGTYEGVPFNSAVGDMALDLSAAAQSEGDEGVILLIDEVGKFVEYAALYPEHGDLIALQQIAECACRVEDNSIAVVAMLHQHFASYAAGVGRSLGDEWHKVAARFEEIAFDEPVERYAQFASQAFSAGDLSQERQIVTAARKEYARAVKQNILRAPTSVEKLLFDNAESLFPLHPMSLAAAATICKRYGQSERSFHAFLYGGELFAVRDFAERTDISARSWYRIQDLYDYLIQGNALRFRELDTERRWTFAKEMIEQHSGESFGCSLLKVIAVFELVKSTLGLKADSATLGWALGESNIDLVEAQLAKFTELGILIKRYSSAEYAFAVSGAVNVEALYEKAARSHENDWAVKGITIALAQKLIVASRHYDQTGTIRTISTLVGTLDNWPQIPSLRDDTARPDAWIKLILISADTTQAKECESRFSSEEEPLVVHSYLKLTAQGRAALSEYAIWSSILVEIKAKSLDPWTTRYVSSRVNKASEDVEVLVLSELIPAGIKEGPSYWHRGSKIENSSMMNPSQIASWLFDRVYRKAPTIVNELINKDRPASAIVLARQRLFEFLLAEEKTKRLCEEHEYPPERLIHTSLLKQTGIWCESGSAWMLVNPPKLDSSNNLSAVWDEISALLKRPQSISFLELLTSLAAPPFGVRNGPAGIWAALYLIINRKRCAIFERGSLVLELTPEHLMRMYKNPHTFEVRELAGEDESKRLISDYQEVFSSIGCQVLAEPSFLEMTRALYRWFIRLPDFSKSTLRIGKDAAIVKTILSKAVDPIALLTDTLPRAHKDSKSKMAFKKWLVDALTDLGMAHRRLQDEVASELSKGFGITGPLQRIRAQLQKECSREASTLADADLRSFILRCTDVVLTDEKWLNSVASLIAHRPLDSWHDDTLAKFQEELTELCGRYRRWMQLVMKRGIAPKAAERFVGLTLTMPGGDESQIFAACTDASDAIARNVMKLINESSGVNTELAEAALAQALLQIQLNKTLKSQEVSNG